MRKVIIITLLGVAIAFIVAVVPSQVSYEAPQAPVTVEKEVVVPELDTLIKEAQEAELAVVEDTAQKAYDNAYEQAMREISTRVRSEYIAELEVINQQELETLQSY